MHPYVPSIKNLYLQNANLAQAAPMRRYMRDQLEYLGIKTPQNAALLKDFIKNNGLPPAR